MLWILVTIALVLAAFGTWFLAKRLYAQPGHKNLFRFAVGAGVVSLLASAAWTIVAVNQGRSGVNFLAFLGIFMLWCAWVIRRSSAGKAAVFIVLLLVPTGATFAQLTVESEVVDEAAIAYCQSVADQYAATDPITAMKCGTECTDCGFGIGGIFLSLAGVVVGCATPVTAATGGLSCGVAAGGVVGATQNAVSACVGCDRCLNPVIPPPQIMPPGGGTCPEGTHECPGNTCCPNQ